AEECSGPCDPPYAASKRATVAVYRAWLDAGRRSLAESAPAAPARRRPDSRVLPAQDYRSGSPGPTGEPPRNERRDRHAGVLAAPSLDQTIPPRAAPTNRAGHVMALYS